MDNYINEQRDYIFRDVKILIYVFDIESDTKPEDFEAFKLCINNLSELSPSAKVFCLIHKIDLIKQEHQDEVRISTPLNFLLIILIDHIL